MNVHSRRWHRIRSLCLASRMAPEGSGVYAYGEVRMLKGLPVGTDWKYVGRTENLKRRLAQHGPLTETNPGLGAWLRRHADEAEVWFTLAPSEDAVELERELVRQIQPPFNHITFKGGSRDG